MTKIEVVISGVVRSFPHEPAALRFIHSFNGHWTEQDEVRFVSPEGKFLARWSITDFLK